jgi:hypothetical protein
MNRQSIKRRDHPQRWRRQTVIAAMLLRVAAFAPVVAACLYFLIFHPAPPAIAVIQATTEEISFVVSAPEMAQIRLNGFSLSYESVSNDAPTCLTGVLIPEPGTKVTYRRFGKGPVSIVYEQPGERKPAVSFASAIGNVPTEAHRAPWVRLNSRYGADGEPNNSGCDGKALTRLPISGPAELGTEIRPVASGEEPSSGLLIEGTVNIFAKTIELNPFREMVPLIYPASTSSITLPAGAKVMEYGSMRQPWFGFVDSDIDRALRVKLTTPAIRLAILRPGVGPSPDVLSISLFTELWNDPMLIFVQFVVVFMFAGLHAVASALSLLANSAGVAKHRSARGCSR